MNKLKSIDLSQPSFIANGETYFIETNDLSIERWAKYEELVLELSYGTSQEQMFHKFKEITELANKLQFADIAILAHNLQKGILLAMERTPVALKICALFMNTKDEDRGVINDNLISVKINNWRVEGYSVGAFFQSALAFSKLISENSSILSQQSLEAVLKQIQQLDQEPINEQE